MFETGPVVVELGHGDVERLLELVEVAVGVEECADDGVLQVLGGDGWADLVRCRVAQQLP